MMLFFGPLGLPEIMVILVLALLLFGPKRLPELGRSLGKGLREFKKGTSGLMDNLNDSLEDPKPPAQTTPTPTATATNQSEASQKPAEEPKKKTVIDLEDN